MQATNFLAKLQIKRTGNAKNEDDGGSRQNGAYHLSQMSSKVTNEAVSSRDSKASTLSYQCLVIKESKGQRLHEEKKDYFLLPLKELVHKYIYAKYQIRTKKHFWPLQVSALDSQMVNRSKALGRASSTTIVHQVKRILSPTC